MPNFPAYIQYAWNKSSHIRVAGIVRNMTYENLVAQRAESKAGWGVFAASTFNVTSKLNFYGQATYGRGISQFLNGSGSGPRGQRQDASASDDGLVRWLAV